MLESKGIRELSIRWSECYSHTKPTSVIFLIIISDRALSTFSSAFSNPASRFYYQTCRMARYKYDADLQDKEACHYY